MREFLAALKEPKVGTRVNCDNPTHIAPFRAFADVLREVVRYYVIWACRAGSKTFLYGGLDTWYKSAVHPRLETKILGGSEEQSRLSYQAMDAFFKLTNMDKELLARPLMRQSAEFLNGSRVSILAASTRSVRGPHPQTLKLDEVDEMDETVYNDALSQPQGRYGIASSLGMFSTNHMVEGLMDKAIARAVEKGHPLYKFCIWECLESCRDFHCSTCKLTGMCPGPHMKEADGYYSIEDFIEKLNTLSWDAVLRDWLCVKTGRGDLIYQMEYNEDLHLVAVQLRLDAPVGLSLDWGGTDPFVAGVWQDGGEKLGKDAWVLVTEVFMSPDERAVTNGRFIDECKSKPWWKQIKWVVYDNSRPDLIAEWKIALAGRDVKFIPADRKSVDEGVECVKSALAPVLGAPKLYINRICLHWRREVKQYAKNPKTGNIIDKFNHQMDATRYWIQAMVKRTQVGYVGVGSRDLSPD